MVDGQQHGQAAAKAWSDMGAWVKLQRDAAMMSRREVASFGGPSISTQQQLEDGGRRTRGEWVLPSPDPKTWGRWAGAVDVPIEELRYAGARVGLWEEDDFPFEETKRHFDALAGNLWVHSRGPHDPDRQPEGGGATEIRLSAVEARLARVETLLQQLVDDERGG